MIYRFAPIFIKKTLIMIDNMAVVVVMLIIKVRVRVAMDLLVSGEMSKDANAT